MSRVRIPSPAFFVSRSQFSSSPTRQRGPSAVRKRLRPISCGCRRLSGRSLPPDRPAPHTPKLSSSHRADCIRFRAAWHAGEAELRGEAFPNRSLGTRKEESQDLERRNRQPCQLTSPVVRGPSIGGVRSCSDVMNFNSHLCFSLLLPFDTTLHHFQSPFCTHYLM